MSFYVFHLPKTLAPGAPGTAEQVRVVRDGFSWLAFVFPLPWLLLNRLWLWSLLYFVASMLLGFVAMQLEASDMAMMVSMLLLSCFIGLEAGNLKSENLRRRGYLPVSSIAAASREEAELKFFSSFKTM